MIELEKNFYVSNQPDEIDIQEFFIKIWRKKITLITFTLISTLFAVIYSLTLPNIYKSSALLSPVGEQNMSSRLKDYSSLASFAGIQMPINNPSSNSVKAIEKLNTLSFFKNNILPQIFLPNLFAIEYWDPRTNIIHYNKNIYDDSTQKWVRKVKFPQLKTPSPQESFEVFKQKHLEISESRDTGFIKISIKHQSPHIAKAWTELLINEINSYYKVKDEAEARAAENFLKLQIAQTSYTEVKQVVAELLQSKTQQLTLIAANDMYVFDYIDPPEAMEKEYSPARIFIWFTGVIIGLILGIFYVVIRYWFFNKDLKAEEATS